MIDSSGFRSNVGILLINQEKQVFWGRRINQDAWQFPQGGIQAAETVEEALFRELHEEIGLCSEDVTILARTRGYLYYRLPKRLVRQDTDPVCIGQKQKWFLLEMKADPSKIRFDQGLKPEFDDWRWVNYWFPFKHVVPFKREVYRRALKELAPFAFHGPDRYPLDPFRP